MKRVSELSWFWRSSLQYEFGYLDDSLSGFICTNRLALWDEDSLVSSNWTGSVCHLEPEPEGTNLRLDRDSGVFFDFQLARMVASSGIVPMSKRKIADSAFRKLPYLSVARWVLGRSYCNPFR